MTTKYRLGVIGFAHMHVNTLIDEFDQHPKVEWVACTDTTPATPSISRDHGTRGANLQRAMEHTKIPKSYDDYREMLEKERFDIIIVCCENGKHKEVITQALAAGAHVVVEKPMATNYAEAILMAKTARHNGVKLAVNWPSTWSAANRKAQALVADGAIGEVWKFKYANSWSLGPFEWGQNLTDEEKASEWWHQRAAGGGAFLDYCCYGACLSRWFIGQPAVGAYGLTANFLSTYGDAEDNGVVVVRFPKAIAMLEGSWSTPHFGVQSGPIVYGSTGTLVCDKDKIRIYKNRSEAPLEYDVGSLPQGRDNIAREFIHHLETGEPLHATLDLAVNLDAMAILDAGLRSADSSKFELAKDENWG